MPEDRADPVVRTVSPDLTPRQMQVLACLLHGDGEKQAAVKLGLSPHSVHRHVKQIYLAYSVHSRSELLIRVLSHRARRERLSGMTDGRR